MGKCSDGKLLDCWMLQVIYTLRFQNARLWGTAFTHHYVLLLRSDYKARTHT